MKILFQIILLLALNNVHAQEDLSWWNTKHNWDGYTPWHLYMTMSSAYMGPNSLPVPEVMKGEIDSSGELEVALSYHTSMGDKTKDFYMRGYLPLYNNRIAVSVDVVPYEWFETDTITRDKRAARTKSGKGGAGGDIYFYTEFQVIRNKRFPDIAIRTAIRVASGTNLSNARFTDGAGYFFDLSTGKNFWIKKYLLRAYLMGGFYAYQTHDIQHLQNDCILYGAGADLHIGKIMLSQSLAGYSGYLDIGDRPVVYRAGIRLKNNHLDWKFTYQWGLNDYDFQRFRLGIVYHFIPPFK